MLDNLGPIEARLNIIFFFYINYVMLDLISKNNSTFIYTEFFYIIIIMLYRWNAWKDIQFSRTANSGKKK